MRKAIIVGVGVLVLACLAGLSVWGIYSTLVSKQIDAQKAWSDVQTEYQRRFDLIPRMVKVAENSMKFQLKLTTEYAKAREGLDSANQKYRDAVNNAQNPKALEKADQAWKDVQDKWNGVNIVVTARSESVPTAQLDQLTELNNEMAAIENVIAKKRQDYNNAVADYNKMVAIPPSSVVAGMYGFNRLELFKSVQGAENAPNVNMNLSVD